MLSLSPTSHLFQRALQFADDPTKLRLCAVEPSSCHAVREVTGWPIGAMRRVVNLPSSIAAFHRLKGCREFCALLKDRLQVIGVRDEGLPLLWVCSVARAQVWSDGGWCGGLCQLPSIEGSLRDTDCWGSSQICSREAGVSGVVEEVSFRIKAEYSMERSSSHRASFMHGVAFTVWLGDTVAAHVHAQGIRPQVTTTSSWDGLPKPCKLAIATCMMAMPIPSGLSECAAKAALAPLLNAGGTGSKRLREGAPTADGPPPHRQCTEM